MAQTSVEWLFYAMQKTPMTDWYKVLEKAKEMHKATLIDELMDKVMSLVLILMIFFCAMNISYWLKEIIKILKDKNL